MSVPLRSIFDEDAPTYDGGYQVRRDVWIEDRTPRFVQLWDSVLFDPDLSANAKVVYAVLQRMAYENPQGMAPSHRAIGERAGIKDPETVSACLDALEKGGHIERVSRGRRLSALIILTLPLKERESEKTRPSGSEEIGYSDSEKTRPVNRLNVIDNVTSPSGPPKTRRKARTALDPDWYPDDTLLGWTAEQGWDARRVAREMQKFKLHHIDKKHTLAETWPGTWRTWVLNGVGYDERDGVKRVAAGDRNVHNQGGIGKLAL